jgi:hypothetical protein
MANRWAKYPMPLVKGVDTKADALLDDSLLAVENGVMTLKGQIAKRDGYERMADLAARKLAVMGNELVAFDGTAVHSWSVVEGAFVERGELPCIGLSYTPVPGGHSERTQGDQAVLGGVRVIAWEDSATLAVQYQVIDEATGVVLVSATNIVNSKMPRVVPCAGAIHLYYVNTASRTLKVKVIRPVNAVTSAAATDLTVVDDIKYTFEPSYDVRTYGTNVLLAYTDESGDNHFIVAIVRPNGSVLATQPYAKANPLDDDTVVLACTPTDAGGNLVVWSTATLTRGAEFDSSLVLSGTFGTVADGAVRLSCAGVDLEDVVDDGGVTSTITGVRSAYIWVETAGTSDANHIVTVYQWISGQGTASPNAELRHSRLCGHGFRAGADGYAIVGFESDLQPTLFLLRGRGHSVASSQFQPFVAGYFLLDEAAATPYSLVLADDSTNLPSANVVDQRVDFVGVYKTRLQSIPTTSSGNGLPDTVNPVYSERGLKIVSFHLDYVPAVAKVGEHLTVAGAMPWMYDGGAHPVEHNFVLFVEGVTLADSAGAGALPAGARSYRVYPEWKNAKGEIEQGHCVATFLHTNAGSKKVVLTIPTIAQTMRTGLRGDLSFAVYRTPKDPFATTPHQRISSLDPSTVGDDNGWVYNDPGADSVTFTDNMLDTALPQGQIDYEFDGTLENVAPLAGRVVFGGHDRLFVTGLEDGNLILPSKLHFAGEVVAFNDGIQIRTDEEGGSITAGALLDNTLVAFKADRIYVFDGSGPDDTGQGGSYSPARLVAADVGCVEPESVVVYGAGVAFKSKKGYYLLDRGQQVVYLGAPVEAYNPQAVTAAVVAPDRNQVVLFTADTEDPQEGRSATTLVLDYYWNQWTQWTNYKATTAVLWDDLIVFCTPQGHVVRQTPGAYTDEGRFVRLAIETPWYGVAGIQGWQAVRAIGLLGHYVGQHGLRISTQYDYEPGFRFKRDWDPQTVIDTSLYGEASPYGTDTYGGAGSRNYQCFYGLKIQKCEAVRFRIEDVPVAGETPTASFVLSSVVLEAAVHGGLARKAATRNVPGPNSGTARVYSGGGSD